MGENRPRAPALVEDMEMADKYYEYRASQRIQEMAEREEALHRDDDPVTLGLIWESVKPGEAARPCPIDLTNNKVSLESILFTYQDEQDYWLSKCNRKKENIEIGDDEYPTSLLLPPRDPSEREATAYVLFYENHKRIIETALKLNRKLIMMYRRKHLPVVTGTAPLQMSGPITLHGRPGMSQIKRQMAEMRERAKSIEVTTKPEKKIGKKRGKKKEQHKLKVIKG